MCTEVTFATGRGPIASLGGPNGDGTDWRLPVADVKQLIQGGLWSFFVDKPTPTPPDRVAVRVGADGSIRTVPDGDPENNLTALPQQPTSAPQREPSSPANFPPARKPTFGGIKTANSGNQIVTSPSSDGLLHVLPTDSISLLLEAPYTDSFQVLVDGDVLPRAYGSSGSPLPGGHWDIARTGDWGPGTAHFLGRDKTHYHLRLRLPPSAINTQHVSLLVAMDSLNLKCPPEGRRSSYLALALSWPVVPAPGNGPPPPPPPPTAGVEHIEGWIQDQTDQFKFTVTLDPFGANKPDHRVITSVTNRASDVNTNPVGVELVKHSEVPPSGTQAGPVDLAYNASTGLFNDLTVTGEWSLHAAQGTSALLLDERRMALDVAWKRV